MVIFISHRRHLGVETFVNVYFSQNWLAVNEEFAVNVAAKRKKAMIEENE